MTEIVRLEQKIYIGPELDSPARRQSQESVVVQNGVQRLDPLRVHVAITHYPRINLCAKIHFVKLIITGWRSQT
jgi:hypothetical protein